MDSLSPERLEVLLERARTVRVLVLGDLMLDEYVQGSASRISPEAPVPVVHVEEEWRALGGAGNVAANVVALGAACVAAGCVGADDAGAHILAGMERLGIDGAGVLVAHDRPTTVKTRVLVRRQQVARYDRESDAFLGDDDAAELAARIARYAADADAVVVEDYDKGVLTPNVIAAALDAARTHALPVVVDPKFRSFFAYRGASVLKPNRIELAAALRETVHPDDPEWMQRTRARLECENLLLTLGEQGMALATSGGDHVRVPTVARSVYDVSGAGDTVTAMIAVALAAGATPIEAAMLANHAAGIGIAKAGVATVSADELRTVVREHFERPDPLARAGGTAGEERGWGR